MATKLAASLARAGHVGQRAAFVASSLDGPQRLAARGFRIATAGAMTHVGPRSSMRAGAANSIGARSFAADPTACAVKVGDPIPNIALDKGFPPQKVMLADYCKGKSVVLVGLPGAFTPT